MSIKVAVCAKCTQKVQGRLVRMEQGILGTYQVYKFGCFTEESHDEWILCCWFERRFRVSEVSNVNT